MRPSLVRSASRQGRLAHLWCSTPKRCVRSVEFAAAPALILVSQEIVDEKEKKNQSTKKKQISVRLLCIVRSRIDQSCSQAKKAQVSDVLSSILPPRYVCADMYLPIVAAVDGAVDSPCCPVARSELVAPDGTHMMQKVSASPSSRDDVMFLQSKLDTELQKRQARYAERSSAKS